MQKMKLFANKLACVGDNITEKELLMRILNGLRPGYLDLTLIIIANKMGYDDAYTLLLTHEARLEQNQNPQAVFNVNCSMFNANYSHMRGNLRRSSHFHKQYGQFGGRGYNIGRDISFAFHPKGFPTGSSNFNEIGRGGNLGVCGK